jgi:hypothetical protein
MATSDRRYEAVYIASPANSDKDLALAITWARHRAGKHGCGVSVIAPSREHFRTVEALDRLPRDFSQQTWRTMQDSRTESVVIACWPNETALARIDFDPHLKALCVLRWRDDESESWRIARGAMDLRQLGSDKPAAAEISDPIVLAAMRSLTRRVNLSTGIHHPDDRDAAINTFRLLKRARRHLIPDQIKTWAMANGWGAKHAMELADLARGVLAGHAYRTRSKTSWVPNILDLWRADAEKADGRPT